MTTEWVAFGVLACWLGLALVRAAVLRARGVSVLVGDRQRTGWQMLADTVTVACLLAFAYETTAYAWQLDFHLGPAVLGTRVVDGPVSQALGALLVTCALGLFATALRDLGTSWRLGFDRQAPGPLVTGGVYRWTRHPIYVAFDTLFVGAFLLNGRASFLALAVVWVPLLHGVMGREERFLTRLYGEAYREYCRHVGRYLPAAQGFIGWLNAANARPKARWVQGLLALGGGLVFLVLIPLALCGLGTMVLPWSRGWVPRGIEVGVGLVAGVLGLALALWSVATFWHTGRGTPVPVAAPQRLVVSGPFAYCRNPMYLGVMMYYLGLASLVVSLPFGVAVSGLGLLVGALYAKEVEEKELPLRFGAAYEEYRRRTPLFLPRWPPKGPGA